MDLRNRVLGRACSVAASVLAEVGPGENKLQAGCVRLFIVNVDLMLLSRRLLAKRYWRHTGYPGGIKSKLASALNKKQLFIKALTNMLPDDKLRRARLRNVVFCNISELATLASEPLYISV